MHFVDMSPVVSAAATVEMLEAATSAAPAPLQFLNRLKPPRWLFRTVACLILGGQVVGRISRGAQEHDEGGIVLRDTLLNSG